MNSKHHQLHIFFFPLMLHGHMTPMIEMAKLFAARGVKATVILTPLNASMFQATVARSQTAGHQIHLQQIQFPCAECGLPNGTESFDSITNPDELGKFYRGSRMLEDQFRRLVENHLPDCIVSDIFFPWSAEVARSFHIPRLVFYGVSFFTLCVEDALRRYSPQNGVESDTEAFLVPDLPDPIKLTKTQLPSLEKITKGFVEIIMQIGEADSKSYGVVANTFYELEPAYVDHFRTKLGKKGWAVGPVSLSNKKASEMEERGKKASIDGGACLSWLASKKPGSVLYICFGSLIKFAAEQLLEIAAALESSSCSFIWVVKRTASLPEGFEERNKDKGLIIRDWAPQMLILNHPSVGAFVTHCGWNSVLEGVTAGLPMIAWPVFAEQFNNEKLITKVLGIGVEVGSKVWVPFEEEEKPVIARERIEEAVRAVMGEGEEAATMKRKARRLGEMARQAVEEGGSSDVDLSRLIEELTMITLNRIPSGHEPLLPVSTTIGSD